MSHFWPASESARQHGALRDDSTTTTTTTTNANTHATASTTDATDDDDNNKYIDDVDDFEIETFDVAPPDSALLNSSAITSNRARPPPPPPPPAARLPASMPSVARSAATANNTSAIAFGAHLLAALPPLEKKPRKPRAPKDPNAAAKAPKLPKLPKSHTVKASVASTLVPVVKQEVANVSTRLAPDFAPPPSTLMPPPPPPLGYDSIMLPLMPPFRRKVGRPRKDTRPGSLATAMFSFTPPTVPPPIPPARMPPRLSQQPVSEPSATPVIVPKREPTAVDRAPEPVVAVSLATTAATAATSDTAATSSTTTATMGARSSSRIKNRGKRKTNDNAEWIDGVELSSDAELDQKRAPSRAKKGAGTSARRKRPARPHYKPAWNDLAMPERRKLAAESKEAIVQCFPAPPLEPGDAERLAAADDFYNALLAPPAVRSVVPVGLPANVMLSRVHSALVGKPFARSAMHVAAAFHAYRGKRTRLVERMGRVRSGITFSGDNATSELESLLPAPQLHDTPNGVGGGMERVAHAVNMLTCMSADPTSPACMLRQSRHLAALKYRCAEERAATLAAMSAAHWTSAAAAAATPSRPITLLDSEIVLPILRPVDRYRFVAAQNAANMGALMAFNSRSEATAQTQAAAIDDVATQLATQQPEPIAAPLAVSVKTLSPSDDSAHDEPALDAPEPEF
jgi:hypothetical protein